MPRPTDTLRRLARLGAHASIPEIRAEVEKIQREFPELRSGGNRPAVQVFREDELTVARSWATSLADNESGPTKGDASHERRPSLRFRDSSRCSMSAAGDTFWFCS